MNSFFSDEWEGVYRVFHDGWTYDFSFWNGTGRWSVDARKTWIGVNEQQPGGERAFRLELGALQDTVQALREDRARANEKIRSLVKEIEEKEKEIAQIESRHAADLTLLLT